jgi:hypothetical protein
LLVGVLLPESQDNASDLALGESQATLVRSLSVLLRIGMTMVGKLRPRSIRKLLLSRGPTFANLSQCGSRNKPTTSHQLNQCQRHSAARH